MNQTATLASSHQQTLYLKIADVIRNEIVAGRFVANQLLPSETEMMEIYGVSRVTVRQAIAVLVEEALVKRVQGKGSFVQELNFKRDVLGSYDLLHDLEEKGEKQTFRIFDYRLITPPKHFNTIFKLGVGEHVHAFRRIKFSNNIPTMLEHLFLPNQLVPNLHNRGIETRWIAQILKEDYGLDLKRVRKTLQPIVIGSREARYLQVASRSIGLLVDRTTWYDDNNPLPLIVTRSIVRGDHARYYVDLRQTRE